MRLDNTMRQRYAFYLVFRSSIRSLRASECASAPVDDVMLSGDLDRPGRRSLLGRLSNADNAIEQNAPVTRCVCALEVKAGRRQVIGREHFKFLMEEAAFDLTRISRVQCSVFIQDDPAHAGRLGLALQNLSSNSTYVNGECETRDAIPRTLRHNDVIGVVTDPHDRNFCVVGLTVKLEQFEAERASNALPLTGRVADNAKLSAKPLEALTAAPPSIHLSCHSALDSSVPQARPKEQNRKRKRGDTCSKGSLWRGEIKIVSAVLQEATGLYTDKVLNCWAAPTTLDFNLPAPWSQWPPLLEMHSRRSFRNYADEAAFEEFLRVKDCSFYLLLPTRRSHELVRFGRDMAQRDEYYAASEDDLRAERSKAQGFLADVDIVLVPARRLPHIKSNIHLPPDGIVAVHAAPPPPSSHGESDDEAVAISIRMSPWSSCIFTTFVEGNRDKASLQRLVDLALSLGGTHLPFDAANSATRPHKARTVSFHFSLGWSARCFASTLSYRLNPATRFIVLNEEALSRTDVLRGGPEALVREKLAEEVCVSAGTIVIDMDALLSDWQSNLLQRIESALHASGCVQGWSIAFGEKEFKALVELGRYSAVAREAVWVPLARFRAAPSVQKLAQSSLLKLERRGEAEVIDLKVVDGETDANSWEELAGRDYRHVRYLIHLRASPAGRESRSQQGSQQHSQPTPPLSLPVGEIERDSGAQRMTISELEQWMEHLRHARTPPP